MVIVTVNAMSMAKYFTGIKISLGYNFDNFLIPVKDFEYQPIHYGVAHQIERFDSYLIGKSLYNDSDYVSAYDPCSIIDDIDVFTFEFDTEEEALYFQMKYCS